MADRDQPQQPTHRAYSVIKRDGQDDFWLNLAWHFRTRTGRASTSCSRPSRSTAKIVCREITADEGVKEPARQERNDRPQQQQRRGGRMAGPIIRKAVESFIAEIAQLPDGSYYVATHGNDRR